MGAAQLLSNHLVGFSWIDGPLDATDTIKPRVFCLTCFVVNVQEHWFLITAGHCMRDFTELVKSKRREIASVTLVDELTNDPSGGIPFAERTNPNWLYFIDDNEGIDCGFLHLSNYYVNLLKAKRIEPISVGSFSRDNNQSFQAYGMVGFPSEFLKLQTTTEQFTSPVGLAYFPLARVGDGLSFNRYQEHFTISAIGSVEDIDGVSGGPVFGFNETDEGLEYRLVGIQCGWFKGEQRIFCTSASLCGGLLLLNLNHWGISIN